MSIIDTNDNTQAAGSTAATATFTATVFFKLAKEGQKAAVLQGLPAAEKQSLTGPLPVGLLEMCQIQPDGSVVVLLRGVYASEIGTQGSYSYGPSCNGPAGRKDYGLPVPPTSAEHAVRLYLAEARKELDEQTPKIEAVLSGSVQATQLYNWNENLQFHPRFGELKEFMAAQERAKDERDRAERAANLAALEPAIAAFLADPEALATHVNYGYGIDLPSGAHVPVSLVGRDRLRELEQVADGRRKANEERKEAEKGAYIDAWIAAHASTEIQQQHADGLLSRRRAIAMIADAALAGTGLTEATYPKFCDQSQCDCGAREIKHLPPEVYGRWRSMRDRLVDACLRHDCLRLDSPFGSPDNGFAAKFEAVRACLTYPEDEQASAGPVQYFAQIKMARGPFQLTWLVEI